MIFGIDTASVAGNQNPNWLQAKAEGPISFAIIRSNFGTARDRTFSRDWSRLKAAAIVRGAYLFLRFSARRTTSTEDQARALIDTVGPLDQADLPPTVDVEFPEGRAASGLTIDECLDHVRVAVEVLKRHYGAAPLIYTSARVWREDLANRDAPDFIESPLWLARYFYKAKTTAARDAAAFAGGQRTPAVPPPWGDADNWWIHQYQGDGVNLPGFPTGNVDMNRFNTLIKGAQGDRVRWVQRRLRISENGRFDASMETALRSFQKRNGLVADAAIGPRTFACLAWE
jgi:GH25 family lysozyme M1 (1,4-beta-N-acetylmuramidase)